MRAPTATEWAPRLDRPSFGWIVAKWAVLAVTLVWLVASLRWPAEAAKLLWYGAVPPLPAAFLVNAELWRNVCPLATLNMVWSPGAVSRPLPRAWVPLTTAIAVALLFLLVPARPLLFERSGHATASLVVASALLALLSGLRFRRKAGFCNAICPVLPVERLYGQRPLLRLQNARCTPCEACTRAGCFDLGPETSTLRVLGGDRSWRSWIARPFGIFALAFPGFVLAYFTMPPEAAASPLGTYGWIGVGALGSWVLMAATVAVMGLPASGTLVFAAAAAAGLYYWFTPPTIAAAFGLPPIATLALRVAGIGLVSLWLARGLRPTRRPIGLAARR